MPVGQHEVRKGDCNHSGRYAARHTKEDEEDQLPALVIHIDVNTRTWGIHQFNMDADARAIGASEVAASRKGAKNHRRNLPIFFATFAARNAGLKPGATSSLGRESRFQRELGTHEPDREQRKVNRATSSF